MLDKVLLTGSGGYIGKAVLESLLSSNLFDVYILSRDCANNHYNNCIGFDRVASINFEYVINCIGETGNNALMNLVNISLCKEIFAQLNKSKLKKFIHFSTVSVYDQRVRGPIDLNSKIHLDSVYSSTKFLFDDYLLSQKQFLDKIIVIRPSNVTQGDLPYNSILRLSFLRIRFFSFRDRFVNWIPLSIICNNLLFLMTTHSTENVYIFNKSETLNNFYKYFLNKRFGFYIPISVELIHVGIVILGSKKLMQKFNQLFSRYYFIQSL